MNISAPNGTRSRRGAAAATRIALIGYGAIGELVARTLGEAGDPRIVAVLMRPGRAGSVDDRIPSGAVAVEALEAAFALEPDLVVECAGQEALRSFGPAVAARGIDLMAIATGALADAPFRERLLEAARASGARVLVPAGATAGLDGLGALRIGGLDRVRYISAKPPRAWRGTRAEALLDLDTVAERTVFFSGRADEAALAFPKNANLAATVALAGAGFERTIVELVADPSLAGNTSRIEAEGRCGRLLVELAGPAMADNPKTSAITALSLVRAIRNEAAAFVI